MQIGMIGLGKMRSRITIKDPKIQNSFTAKLIAVIRNEFGGYEIRKR